MSKAHIQELIAKAAATTKSDDAQRFAQAACNAAQALTLLNNLPQ